VRSEQDSSSTSIELDHQNIFLLKLSIYRDTDKINSIFFFKV